MIKACPFLHSKTLLGFLSVLSSLGHHAEQCSVWAVSQERHRRVTWVFSTLSDEETPRARLTHPGWPGHLRMPPDFALPGCLGLLHWKPQSSWSPHPISPLHPQTLLRGPPPLHSRSFLWCVAVRNDPIYLSRWLLSDPLTPSSVPQQEGLPSSLVVCLYVYKGTVVLSEFHTDPNTHYVLNKMSWQDCIPFEGTRGQSISFSSF